MNYLLVVDQSSAERQQARALLTRHFDYEIEEASDGCEAIEFVENQLPLAVVTDLLMSEMSGLELTQIMQRRFPRVPVIVMTTVGSEDMAADALLQGAADYFPKSAMDSELCRAVEAVLSVTSEPLGEPRLCQILRYVRSCYELESNLILVPPLVRHLERMAHQLDLVEESGRIRFAKALREAIRNAICHGSLALQATEIEPPQSESVSAAAASGHEGVPLRERRVTVDVLMTLAEARFTIRDEGPGFHTEFVDRLTADRSRLTRNEPRGLVLIKTFMDEVLFNAKGNEVTLVKRKTASAT